MYCTGCGFENIQGVNFCKRCGANLHPAPAKMTSPWMAGVFLLVIAFITVIGFVGPMIMMSELSHRGIDLEPLMAMAFFFLAATTVIDVLLIRLLTRLLGFAKVKYPAPGPVIPQQPKYVTNEQAYQPLPEAKIAMPSVTEHTTRNFDPVITEEHRSRIVEQRNRETS